MAGLASGLPAASMARTAKVWVPALRPLMLSGDAQALNAAPSSAQAKVDPPSLDAKPNVAEVSDTVPDGPEVIEVSGAVESAPPEARTVSTRVGGLLVSREATSVASLEVPTVVML